MAALHAIAGTALQGLVCTALSVPIGVMVAIYLVEYGGGTPLGRLANFHGGHPQRGSLDRGGVVHLRAVVATIGFPRSAFAVSLALVLLMVPVIVRATEEMLRIVPMDLREASYALGITKWKTIAGV